MAEKFGKGLTTLVIDDWRTAQVTVDNNFTQLPDRKANQLVIENTTGKQIGFRRNAYPTDDPYIIQTGNAFTLPLASNTNEVSLANLTDATNVTLSYYIAQ